MTFIVIHLSTEVYGGQKYNFCVAGKYISAPATAAADD